MLSFIIFKVIGTENYLDEIKKLSKDYRNFAEELPNKLKENPFQGKPLNYQFLREKRIREKRVYYLIYEDLELVLLVAVSGKKDQQYTIDHIKDQLDEYGIIAEQISRQVS